MSSTDKIQFYKQLLENIFNNNPSFLVEKIIDVQVETVVGPGENFCSELLRLSPKVLLKNGSEKTQRFIFKCLPTTGLFVQSIVEFGIFKTEINMYKNILPSLEKLIKENNWDLQKLWPECYHCEPDELLVLEDIKEKGYVLCDKQKGYSVEGMLTVVQALAQYHALSRVYALQNNVQPSDFQGHFLLADNPMFEKYRIPSAKILAQTMRNNWGPEWLEIADKIDKNASSMVSIIENIREGVEDKFKTVAHGDCWTNNIMVKFEGDQPVHARLLDFQAVHFNSGVCDLQHLLTTSIDFALREKNYLKILQTYQEAYNEALSKLGYSSEELTLDDLVHEMDRTNYYGYLCTVTELPLGFLDKDTAAEIQTTEDDEMSGFLSPDMYKAELLTEQLKLALKYYSSKGTI